MPLTSEQLLCSRCSAPIPPDDWNREHAFCAVCRAPLSVSVFPAFFSKSPEPSSGAAVTEAGEASCFYHPQKRALVPCDQCGRFLCALCQVEFQGQNWCPRCIDAASQKGRLAHLDPSRTLHDNQVLALAIASTLLFAISIIMAPVTLYLIAQNWNAPSSILPRTKIRFVIAALIALAQLTAWGWFIYFLIHRR